MTGKYLGLALAILLASLLTACNKAAEERAGTEDEGVVAQLPEDAPQQRRTTGGNLPPPDKVEEEVLVDLHFNSFTTGEAKLSDFSGKPLVVNLWAVW